MTQKEFASKGGKSRALKLSKESRIEIAKKAAKSRWLKPTTEEKVLAKFDNDFPGISHGIRSSVLRIEKCAYCNKMGTSKGLLFGELRWFCEDHARSSTP